MKDMYDEMDAKTADVDKMVDKIAETLGNHGYVVKSVEYPTYETDGLVNMPDGWHVQVTMDGQFLLNRATQAGFWYGAPLDSIGEMLIELKEKQQLIYGGAR